MERTVQLGVAQGENIGSAVLTTCTVLPLRLSALKRLILFASYYTRIYKCSNKREYYFLLLLMGIPPTTALLQKSDGQLGVLGFVWKQELAWGGL